MTSAGGIIFRIEIEPRAVRDLEILYVEKRVEDAAAAAHWFQALEKAIWSLQYHPNRCPRIRNQPGFQACLRHLLHGTAPNVYRVIFTVDEGQKLVRILTIRHGAREPFSG